MIKLQEPIIVKDLSFASILNIKPSPIALIRGDELKAGDIIVELQKDVHIGDTTLKIKCTFIKLEHPILDTIVEELKLTSRKVIITDVKESKGILYLKVNPINGIIYKNWVLKSENNLILIMHKAHKGASELVARFYSSDKSKYQKIGKNEIFNLHGVAKF